MPLQTWTHSLASAISHRRSRCSLHCWSGSWAYVSHRDESSRTCSDSMASNRLHWLDFWLWSCRKWFATGVISSKHGISSLVVGLWSMNSPDTYSPSIYSLVAMTACMMVIWFLVLRRQRPGYMPWWIKITAGLDRWDIFLAPDGLTVIVPCSSSAKL